MPLQSTSGAATYDAFGAPAASAVTQADAIDYDGTNDWVSRTAGLTGVSNGKTFTLSFWVWNNNPNYVRQQIICNTGAYPQQFTFSVVGNSLQFRAFDNSGNNVLQGSADSIPLRTWTHILVSFNTANTAQRSVYINDVFVDVSFSAYQNFAINFANGGWYVGVNSEATDKIQGRLSNVYFDQTYRDLSITANRRLFVTADLKPALGQAALNPIMYLPMSDPTQPGLNQGTGGNFTLTGTVARAGRGPNQYNAPSSTFNGTTNYLYRSTVGGQSKQLTLAFNVKNGAFGWLIDAGVAASPQSIYLYGSNNSFTLTVRNSANTTVLSVDFTTPSGYTSTARWINYVLSVDLSNSSNRAVYVNGTAVAASWNAYTNDNMDLSPGTTLKIGTRYDDTNFFSGQLSALYLTQSYIDLSVQANREKFVTGTGINAAPANLGATGQLPTGTSPLIYLPMYDNNPGKNYGTGGDFTSSGGFPSAGRGPNEFWGNKADFNGTTGYLSKLTSLSGVSNSKTVSLSFWVSFDTGTSYATVFFLGVSSGGVNLWVNRDGANTLNIYGVDATGATCLDVSSSFTLSTGTPYFVQFSADLSNSSKRALVINGTVNSATWRTYSNAALNLTTDTLNFGRAHTGGMYLDGKIAEFYLTTDYIDFTQEANRLKFRDCFGNPTDLPSAITAVSIPTPAIYLRFPPTSFGTNSGTGGNFTVNGTITDGGQL